MSVATSAVRIRTSAGNVSRGQYLYQSLKNGRKKNNTNYSIAFSGLISDTCDEDFDCFYATPNTICSAGLCSCESGYRNSLNNDKCLKGKLL